MPKPERRIDADGPVAEFALALRALRQRAGSPTYRQMASAVRVSAAALSLAAAGRALPTWAVASAYIRACGDDPQRWHRRWEQAATQMQAAAVAGTVEQN